MEYILYNNSYDFKVMKIGISCVWNYSRETNVEYIFLSFLNCIWYTCNKFKLSSKNSHIYNYFSCLSHLTFDSKTNIKKGLRESYNPLSHVHIWPINRCKMDKWNIHEYLITKEDFWYISHILVQDIFSKHWELFLLYNLSLMSIKEWT